MDIGNTNARLSTRSKQGLEDIESNACFIYHKPGFLPYKHRQRHSASSVTVANVETAHAATKNVDSDSSEK